MEKDSTLKERPYKLRNAVHDSPECQSVEPCFSYVLDVTFQAQITCKTFQFHLKQGPSTDRNVLR